MSEGQAAGAAALGNEQVQPTGATSGSAPVQNAAPVNDWTTSIADQSTRDWVQAKGWKDPGALATSAYNLEKLIGHDRAGRTVVRPGENATPEEIASFRVSLGAMKTPEEYIPHLSIPEGHPDGFAKTAAGWFHKHGIPADAAKGITEDWNAFQAGLAEQQQQEFLKQSDKEYQDLLGEWGKDADRKAEMAKRFARGFFDPSDRDVMVEKLERALGTGAMLKLFAEAGERLGEGRFINGGASGSFGMSPSEARAKMTSLQNDKTWMQAYLGGDKNKIAEMSRLIEVSNGT